MTTFAQGQPFNSGPVWDQMRFGSEQTTETMPIAGSLADPLAAIFSTPSPPGLSKDMEAFFRFGQLQRFNAAEVAKQNKEMMQQYLTYQQQASERANEMGIKNQLIGSFLKDVPAAISNAFAQRQRYAPEKIEIAARAMQSQPRGGTIPNYYSFVG
jgi:hypothetical protein